VEKIRRKFGVWSFGFPWSLVGHWKLVINTGMASVCYGWRDWPCHGRDNLVKLSGRRGRAVRVVPRVRATDGTKGIRFFPRYSARGRYNWARAEPGVSARNSSLARRLS